MKKTFGNLIELVKKHHILKPDDMNQFNNAFNFLEECKKRTNYNTEHALSVAFYIAECRFNYDTVIAALLHEIPLNEIKPRFHKTILKTLESYHDIRGKFKKIQKKYELTGNYESFLPLDLDLYSFYIIIADELKALQDSQKYTKDVLLQAKYAREILVPQVQKIQAYKIADELLDACLNIENHAIYTAITKKIAQKKLYGKYYQHELLKKMEFFFNPHNQAISPSLQRDQSYIKYFNINDRALFSIYRYIHKKRPQTKSDFIRLLQNSNLAMYDITLIINDDIHKESTLSPIDIFFHYFHIYSKELGLFILDYCNTTHKDSSYFMLCDTMNNLYRFFVKTETDYSYYLFGDIIDNDKNVFIFHNPENKINVFKDDGACTTMPVGSTVLDFAFKLHEDIGLSFDYALLNNNTEHIPAHTQLNQGDAVKIVQKDDYSAEIQWFRYVKNPTSVNSLIKYFAKELSRLKQDKEITITTEDGLPTRIANGATALDVAFQIHEDLGLHFSYALINGKKKHMPAHTLLRDGDYVIIKKANNVSPDLQWFGYVKTRYAVKRLIQYFKKKYNYFN